MSTRRHMANTSQYPLRLSQGVPGTNFNDCSSVAIYDEKSLLDSENLKILDRKIGRKQALQTTQDVKVNLTP